MTRHPKETAIETASIILKVRLDMSQERKAVMASIYKRGNKYWVSYYINNKQIKKSLGTDNERVARSKVRKIEYELALVMSI